MPYMNMYMDVYIFVAGDMYQTEYWVLDCGGEAGWTFIGLVLIVDSLLSLLRRLGRPTSQRLLHRPGFHTSTHSGYSKPSKPPLSAYTEKHKVKGYKNVHFFLEGYTPFPKCTPTLWIRFVAGVSLENDRPHQGAKLSLAFFIFCCCGSGCC